MSPVTVAILAAAAAFAGWIDAVIGGGGLVLIPVLMGATGLPAASVLATNKIAAVTGTASAAVTLVRRVGVPRVTWALAAAAFAASACGARAVSLVSDEVVRPVIIVLLLAVGAFVAARPEFGSGGGMRVESGRRKAIALSAAGAIGLYDGIFGPGTGMFLIMALTAIFSQSFLESSAMAKVINTATNLGALSVFILGGYVQWKLALGLAAANLVGAQLGARTVLAGGSKLVRYALLGLVVVLSTKLMLDEFA
ncbi:TSUP family transporter [Corynebacterium bouchesdurhonense]|uniref:TSUP family transporter n=1 Tax=Corynebacterium bouchesdurhonense TaxID=1720192 RepID=UPI000836A066|nr:TSUP family transporter [Corynebacterium bouchesdurhonense]